MAAVTSLKAIWACRNLSSFSSQVMGPDMILFECFSRFSVSENHYLSTFIFLLIIVYVYLLESLVMSKIYGTEFCCRQEYRVVPPPGTTPGLCIAGENNRKVLNHFLLFTKQKDWAFALDALCYIIDSNNTWFLILYSELSIAVYALHICWRCPHDR